MTEARYWDREGAAVICRLCPHECRIAPGRVGRCGVRRNVEGTLQAETYGRISSLALDPIEKKPLYHFRPGQRVLSAGSAGCNFRCGFCQNWSISQARPPLSPCSPAELIAGARAENAVGVAYTYNEPLVNLEWVLDCARLAREAGLANVLVTNGYVNPGPRDDLLPWIDAWNIDLKSARPGFYRRFCGAELGPVLDTLRAAVPAAHVELTHLIVTGGNDREDQLRDLVETVAKISTEVPLHFSRYFPEYRWNEPPTPADLLERAVALGRERLAWVYAGNLPGRDDSTFCPECGERLIERSGYRVGAVAIVDGRCPRCRRQVPGVF